MSEYSYENSLTGFKPSDVAEYFKSHLHSLLDKALNAASTLLSNVDLVCYTKGPGIGNCLDLVATFAKTIAYFLKVDIVGVNHCVARMNVFFACVI